MVQVQYYCVVFDLFDNWFNGLAAGILPLQLHAYLDMFRNDCLRDLPKFAQIFRPVTFLWWHDHMLGLSDRHTLHCIFKTSNDPVSACLLYTSPSPRDS